MKMKKFLSVLLVVAMLMSMVVLPVSAEEIRPIFAINELNTVTLAADDGVTCDFVAPASGNYILFDVNENGFQYNITEQETGNHVVNGWWTAPNDGRNGPTFDAEEGKTYEIYIHNDDGAQVTHEVMLVQAEPLDPLVFSRTELTGRVGETLDLRIAAPSEYAFETIRWSSSNPDVADVGMGPTMGKNIECFAPGTTTITATAVSGEFASCEVTVTGTAVDVIPLELDQPVDFFVAYQKWGEFTFTPAESGRYIIYAPEQTYCYSVVSVAGSGETLARNDMWESGDGFSGTPYDLIGGVTYSIRMVNGHYSQSDFTSTVTVTKAQNYESLEFSWSPSGAVGESTHVRLQGSPQYASEAITWTVSDESVVIITDSGDTGADLEFVGVGTATLTASTNKVAVSCTVTVRGITEIQVDQTVDVTIPGDGYEVFLFTAPETGRYIFYSPWDHNLQPDAREKESGRNVSGDEWTDPEDVYYGWAYDMTEGMEYQVNLNNWDSADQVSTFSVVKAQPYATLGFEGEATGTAGETIRLNLAYEPRFASESLTWVSSDTDIVEILSHNGPHARAQLNALGTATVTVTAAHGGAPLIIEITVKEARAIELDQPFDISLDNGASETLYFTPPADGRYIVYAPEARHIYPDVQNTVTGDYVYYDSWSSYDYTNEGYAFDLAGGEKHIIKLSNWYGEGNISTTFTVVAARKYDHIEMSQKEATAYAGSSFNLSFNYSPEYASESAQWVSSDPSVVSVEYVDGSWAELVANKIGTATITVSTADGRLTDSCTVTVTEMPSLSAEPTQIVIPAGESVSYGFTPAESGNYIFYRPMNQNYGIEVRHPQYGYMDSGEWYSDDDTYYGSAVALTGGEQYLIQLNNWNGYDQTVTIAVANAVPYEHIAFRNAPLGFVGETAYVLVAGGPGFAYETLQWSSSNTAVASIAYVNGTGINVECLSVGTTIITATTSSGLSVSYEMTVQEKAVLEVGETTLLTIPQDTYTKAIFTPAEDGTYIFEYPFNTYFDINCYDNNWNWPNSADWTSSDGSRRGRSFSMKGGTTYTLEVYNWNVQGNAELELTVAKAVPYTKLAFTQNSFTGYASNFQSTPVYIDYAPEYGGEELIITSSDTNVVDGGWVSGDCIYLNTIDVGTATVTIKTADGRLSDTCTVTVKEPVTITSGKEQSVTLDPGALVIFKFVAPTNGTYSFYCADSDYFGYSTHDANGEWIETADRWTSNALISDIDTVAGETYYIAFNSSSDERATYTVGIGQPTEATGLTIPAYEYTVYTDFYFYLAPVFAPVLAQAEEMTWTSSNENVAVFVQKCEYEGGYVDYEFYAVGAGTTTITATTSSGLKATCKITVVDPGKISVGTKSVTLSKWDMALYEFVAPAAGTYVIYDEDPDSLVGWYADETNGTMQGYVDGNKRGTKITLAAGEIAWPAVQNNTDETKTCTFVIEEGVHEHEPVYVAEKAPTLAEDGMKAHYACACGKLFVDAEGTTEITAAELLIPKLIQVEDGKAEIPKEAIDSAVEEVEQGGEVSIPVADAGAGEEVKSAALPVESLTQITEKEAALTVEMPAATVTMDTAALAAVVEKAGENANVTLEVAEVAKEDLTESQVAAIEELDKNLVTTISAELLVNGQNIATKDDDGFGGGKVTVKIPIKLAGDDYAVLFIADDGSITEITNTTYENGILTMELEHFSDYAIVQDTLLGDVNGDGSISVSDLMRLANHFAKGTEINKANADVNCDGKVTVSDLMRLANFFAGKAQLG